MKRCGQLLSLLWVSATLVWSQAPAVSRPGPDGSGARWSNSQVQSSGLLSDFTLNETKKTTEPSGEADNLLDPAQHAATLHRHTPVLLCLGTATAVPVEIVSPLTIRLPLSCGPPAQV